jgi:hypothetical protein
MHVSLPSVNRPTTKLAFSICCLLMDASKDADIKQAFDLPDARKGSRDHIE